MVVKANTYVIERKFEGTTEWFIDLCARIAETTSAKLITKQQNLASVGLRLPDNNGTIEFIMLEEGFSILKSNCFLQNNIVVNHLPNNEYIHSFFHFSLTLDTTYIDIADQGKFEFGQSFSKAIFYSSSNLNFKNIYPAHKKIKFVNVFATREWMGKKLHQLIAINSPLNATIFGDDPFQKMYNLNLQCYDLVNEIIQLPCNSSDELLYLKGKILILLSIFCETAEHNMGREELRFIEDSRLITNQVDKLLMDIHSPWPDLDSMADRCGLSRTKFVSIFKKKYGKSYYSFYTDARLVKAYEAIVNEKSSIAEAAWGIGFTNLGHFSKLFKQYFGVLPSSLK